MWRAARPDEDDLIVAMCLELYREDPGPAPVAPERVRHTLRVLRHEPSRGQAIVLEIDQRPIGYAFLIAFWSNELGGEVCEVDELFVTREYRNQGYGRSLFTEIERGTLWRLPVAAISLGVTPDNARARRLYERLGFATVGISMARQSGSSVT